MKARTGIGLGVLAALLVGSLAAAGLAMSTSGEPFPTVQVPVGAIGDEFAYETVSGFDVDPEEGLVPWVATEEQRHRSRLLLRVDGTQETQDETLETRGALRVVAVRDDQQGSACAPLVQLVDLATRSLVRFDQACAFSNQSRFGPTFPRTCTCYDAYTEIFRFQGQSVGPGTEIRFVHKPEYRLPDFWRFHETSTRAWVSGHGTLDGAPVIAVTVETEYLASLQNTRDGAWQWEHVLETRVEWISARYPYPVEIHATYDERYASDAGGRPGPWDEHWVYGFNQTLVAFRPGTDPIPWQPWAPHRTRNDRAEFSPPTQAYPADGAKPFANFRLSEAIQNSQDSPGAQGLRDWQARSPGFFLAGAAYTCCAPYSLSNGNWDAVGADLWARWDLLYTVASGSSYQISARRNLATGAVIGGLEGQEFQLRDPERVSRTDFPAAPITLGTVRTIWEQLAFPALAADPPGLRLEWGLGSRTNLAKNVGPLADTGPEFARRVNVVRTEGTATRTVHELQLDPRSGNVVAASDRVQGRLPSGAQDVSMSSIKASAGPNLAPGGSLVVGAAAASTLLIWLAAYFFPVLKVAVPPFMVPGYAKIRREALLDHRSRDELVAQIREDPGISPPELQQASGLAWSTLVYHLGVLEKNRLISSVIDGRHKRLFPVDSVDWNRRPALAILRNRRTKEFFETISAHPGATQKDLAGQAGLSHASGVWHLQRLERVGLVTREKRGHRVHYFPAGPTASPGMETA